MDTTERKQHWEHIYQTKQLSEVSWYEPLPSNSVMLIKNSAASKNSAIIDVGGGDSLLVDNLLTEGFTNLTVLDISEAAIERAKQRLGAKAAMVKWIIADAADFIPETKYDVWHDRAAFHFLTKDEEISGYRHSVKEGVSEGGALIIGTFSEEGPTKCSGIDIKQYTKESMSNAFKDHFESIKFKHISHRTPFNTEQKFLFGVFRKK